MEPSSDGLRTLRVRADLYRSLLDVAPYATLVEDGRGAIVFANVPSDALFGYARDAFSAGRLDRLGPSREGSFEEYVVQW